MDIEELSRSQLVLLTLLISFITSTATCIVTISLMSQSTPEVAQTVNRVIEQTIDEAAAPSKTSVASAASPLPTKSIVVISDQSAQSVAKVTPSLVRLYSSDGTTFLGLGVVINSSGTIVTDMSTIPGTSQVMILRSDGTSISGTVGTRDSFNQLAFLSPATSSLATSTSQWSPVALAAVEPSLGENVISFAGKASTRIASGLITQIIPADSHAPALAESNISGDNLTYGSPFIDTAGELIGISTSASRAQGAGDFIPASSIIAESTNESAKETGTSEQ